MGASAWMGRQIDRRGNLLSAAAKHLT